MNKLITKPRKRKPDNLIKKKISVALTPAEIEKAKTQQRRLGVVSFSKTVSIALTKLPTIKKRELKK